MIAGITSVRIVCNNTLQLAINGAQRTWNLRHTESIKGKQAEAEQALGLALNYTERVKEDAIRMAGQKVREEAFFRELFKKMNLSEKSTEKVGLAIADIYHNKEDLQNFKGTAWGLYNAVADFVSNGEPLRKTSTSADWKMANFMNGYSMLSAAEDILKSA